MAENYPNIQPPATPIDHSNSYATGNDTYQAVRQGAQSVGNALVDNPVTNSVRETVAQGRSPVAQSVQNQTAKTTADFKELANARTIPDQRAATGQQLTQYHSLFSRLLSWRNPRATAIAYFSTVLLIFAGRYVDVLSYTFKLLYLVLGATATIEIVGKAAVGRGLATQFRPRRYYVIPRDSLERVLGDVEQLINFFVIEIQRIVFAENIYATVAAFFAAFLSYWLIKWLPIWGLTLLGTSVLYLAPLVYLQNQEYIDAHLRNAGDVLNSQANQVIGIAAHHTSRASETVKSYAGEYTQKAQGVLGSAKHTVASKIPSNTAHSSTGPSSTGQSSTGLSSTGPSSSGLSSSGLSSSGLSSTGPSFNGTSSTGPSSAAPFSSGLSSNTAPSTSVPGTTASYNQSDFPQAPKREPNFAGTDFTDDKFADPTQRSHAEPVLI